MVKKSTFPITIDSEILKHFKILCIKKDVDFKFAIKKLMVWSLKQETGVDFDLTVYEKYKREGNDLIKNRINKGNEEMKKKINLLVLEYEKGLSYVEVSKKTGIPLTTTRRILRKVEGYLQ